MKKFLRPLVTMAACAAITAACIDHNSLDEPVHEDQTVNTWIFNDGDEVKAGSALISESSGCITILFSAESGLATDHEIHGAEDCTEIRFQASSVGSEIDLTAITGDNCAAYFKSRLPEFGENGLSIDGKAITISKGKLSSSLENDEMSIKCGFTTLGTNIRFSLYLRCPLKHDEIPEPDGNYYEYAGKVVELKSVYAFRAENGSETSFGFYAAPDEGMETGDIKMSEHQLSFMIDGASLSGNSAANIESVRSVLDVKHLPDGCKLQITLVNSMEGLRVSIPDNTVTGGTIIIYFTKAADGYVINVSGNIAFSNGMLLKMSCVSPLVTEKAEENTSGEIEYTVKSRNISEKAFFRSGFYHRNTWDEGIAFTYAVSNVPNYIKLGSNAYVEIYAGAEQLLNGKAFDVARTNHPFSFKIEYLDRAIENLVPVIIDNNNRAGASGSISFKKNEDGLYDAQFDLTLDYGDITVKGNFSGKMKQRNIICTDREGKIDDVRSATLDVSGDPCILYMSAQDGTAGPEQYDVKCEVPASEWKYGIYMAFSSQSSAVTWIDGFRYSSGTSHSSTIFGGNWRVFEPVAIPGGGYASECRTTLYGNNSFFAYYYGEIKVID